MPVLALPVALTVAAAGCGSAAADDPISIGLMLSYTGYLAANSVNSERALWMAIEATNAAGGVGGRRVQILARDTRSDVTRVSKPASELIAAGVAAFIGPDTNDLVTQLRPLLIDRTIVLPSFNTASQVFYKPAWWFTLGASTLRVACDLVEELRADGRQSPLVIFNPTGYNNTLAWDITNRYGLPKSVLPTDRASTASAVAKIASAAADSYVLAALPPSGTAFIYGLAFKGALTDPSRWYLSPTLHTPLFVEAIPNGALDGAHGVAPVSAPGTADFWAAFAARWQDMPLDDAYVFYDTGAVIVLALQHALTQRGAIPTGTGLSEHLVAVTHAGATPVRWNEIDRGLAALQRGEEIEYIGLSGVLEFDATGQTPAARTGWWKIQSNRFQEIPRLGDCR
jgi:branched-chain amino acid transport system substrate-binding protein